MSGIRKYIRRRATPRKQRKTPTKTSLLEVMMIAGGAMVFIGVIAGVLCYAVYSAGRQEYISHGIDGTTYNPAQAPGEPGRRAMAYVGFTVAGLGAVLVLLSVTAYLIGGRLRRPAGKAS